MSVIIYFKNGTTALFNEVEDFDIADANGITYVGFTYFGVSTQVRRKAMFSLNNIAGFAEEIKA
ncbi:MAG: hypothetical protein LBE23_13670 [Vagococcus sp.]|jgi:hypothetical protein|nr:hypothetical protein [Vagococcus sp.]